MTQISKERIFRFLREFWPLIISSIIISGGFYYSTINPDFSNFIIPLTATLGGIFLAFWLNYIFRFYIKAKEDRNKLVQLLMFLKQELTFNITILRIIYQVIEGSKKDDVFKEGFPTVVELAQGLQEKSYYAMQSSGWFSVNQSKMTFASVVTAYYNLDLAQKAVKLTNLYFQNASTTLKTNDINDQYIKTSSGIKKTISFVERAVKSIDEELTSLGKSFSLGMKVYFATHATTKDNEADIASGWKDVELSELGIKQAKKMKERFKDIKINLICCSDLKRAVDTVKIAFGNKYPIIADKRLRELNYGDFNGKPSKTVGYMKKERIKEPFPNGESYEQAMVRIHEFYKEVKEKYPVKTVLVVGHRATQFGLDTLVGGKTLEECLNTIFKWQPYWEYEL